MKGEREGGERVAWRRQHYIWSTHIDLYSVSTNTGPDYIVVTWTSDSTVPQVQQQLHSVHVTLTEECHTQLRPPRTVLSTTVLPEDGSSLNATGLGMHG